MRKASKSLQHEKMNFSQTVNIHCFSELQLQEEKTELTHPFHISFPSTQKYKKNLKQT